MSAPDKRSYEFGSFRLDAAEYVLLRDGQVVPLTPKVFETLLVLVQNSGHVVDKTELYKRVWQDAFVEETNLTKNISILRKILSEGDGDRTFIETVPKRGYRFVVPVRETDAEYNGNGATQVTVVNPPVDVARPTSSVKVAGVLGIVAIVIAGVGFGLYRFAFQKQTRISLAPTQITRVTSSGTVIKAAISADGKWLVYSEYDNENQSLWLKQVAVPGSNRQIAPSAPMYQGVSISPDGNYVCYTLLQRDNWEGVLYKVPILGGEARKVLTGIYGTVAFSPDGKRIAFYRWVDDEDRLIVANADGTEERQLLARRGNEYLVFETHGPSWSPDSKTLLTTIGTFAPDSMMVAAVSLEDGSITAVGQQKFSRIRDIAWLPDGQDILVSATNQFGSGASSKIWHIAYPSGNAQRVTKDLNSYTTIGLTADSNTLATVQTETLGNLWIASLDDISRGSQITTGTNLANYPSWTPDGKVVYALNSGDNFDLFIFDPREGTSKQLTSNSGYNNFPSVSPDGRYIVFNSDRSGVFCIWRMDIDGSNLKQLTHQTSKMPRFAPDGRTITYEVQANKPLVATVSIEGGEARYLTKNYSRQPVFSPDGTQIACLYSEELNSKWSISIIPAIGGPPVKTFPVPTGLSIQFSWAPDGKGILYGLTRGGVTNLWLQPIDGSKPKQISNFTSDLIHSFDLSRDGKQFVFSRGTNRSDVVLFSGIKQ